MKKSRIAFIGLAMTVATPAFADHVATVIGAAVGGAAGTAISQNTHQSRNATVLWSAVGAGAGAAVGRKLGEPHAQPVINTSAYAQPYYGPAAAGHAPAQQVQYVPVYQNDNTHWRATQAQPAYYQAYRNNDQWRGKHWKKHKNKHKQDRRHDYDDDDD